MDLDQLLDFDVTIPERKRRRPGPDRRYGTSYVGPGVDSLPPTPPIMDAAAGDWVLRVVLPKAYVRNTINRICACQYGICGACSGGRCDRCLSKQLGRLKRSPAAHITDRRGFVANARGVSAAVWLKNTPCRYLCPCRCPKTAPAPKPAVRLAERPEQLDLMDLLGVAV